MSVDAKARLVYGWRVGKDEVTNRFRELMEGDFMEIDDRCVERFGMNGYELARRDDEHDPLSGYHIGVDVPTDKRVVYGDGSCDFRFEDFGIEEFAAGALRLKWLEDALSDLYFDMMGDYPSRPPYVDLYVETW